MRISRSVFVFAAALAVSSPLLAHHSDAGVDMKSVVAFSGTVREFAWRNPHVYVVVERSQDGRPVRWELQMGAVSGLSRRGWTSKTLAVGDTVTVRAHPADGGRPYGIVESIDKPGGLALAAATAAPVTTPPAKSLAGRWLTDPQSVLDFPAGTFDAFFHAKLVPTEKGKAAQSSYNALAAMNPESTCVGRPTPAALVSSGLYLLEFDLTQQSKVVTIRSEAFNEVRTVYMDGRKHPSADQRFAAGHSIGRWDGDTLVVDTTNFADHRSPYQTGVPSGSRKHVVERYRLTREGTRIEAEFTLEDPEFLAQPLTHRRLLTHSPHLQMFLADCDPKAANRFLSR